MTLKIIEGVKLEQSEKNLNLSLQFEGTHTTQQLFVCQKATWQESALSSHHKGPENQIQAIQFGTR